MQDIQSIFVRDLKLIYRAGGSTLIGVLFLLAMTMTVSFGVGQDLKLLARIGSPILWTGAILASLLTLEQLFHEDHNDGSLELIVLHGDPLTLIILSKCLAHWVATSLPLVLSLPLFGIMMNMNFTSVCATMLTLLVGTPAITFIGAFGASLTVILPRGGLLNAIIVLPLTIPVLVFGTSAVRGAIDSSLVFMQPFLFLSAVSLVFALIGTIASAWTLKQLSH